mgnify:CR=1 FL=1
MKHYNMRNYIAYKTDVEKAIKRLEGKFWDEYTREELIIKFLPLVENLARKFSTSQQASGVMSILDLIEEGNIGLIKAVDKINWSTITSSEDAEKTIKSYLSKRIKGAVRRAIDMNRGGIRIPEHKLNEIRKAAGDDKKAVAMFFNSIFKSLDDDSNGTSALSQSIEDIKEYDPNMLNAYIMGMLKIHLNPKEFEVIRLSYGLDCDKHTASQIAEKLGINGTSSYVRVSQLKKQALDKLINNVSYEQVIDFL